MAFKSTNTNVREERIELWYHFSVYARISSFAKKNKNKNKNKP